jgi:hypothetical protein
MPDYLVCSNPSCRLVVDLQECREPSAGGTSLDPEKIGLSLCPECACAWAAACPFCAKELSIIWHGHHAHCAHCHRRFHARAA